MEGDKTKIRLVSVLRDHNSLVDHAVDLGLRMSDGEVAAHPGVLAPLPRSGKWLVWIKAGRRSA